jgi:hypothetical protein
MSFYYKKKKRGNNRFGHWKNKLRLKKPYGGLELNI